MPTEKVSVTVPGFGPQIIDVMARWEEDDRDIALRLAKGFPVGTLLSVSGGRWRVMGREPPKVEEVLQKPSQGPRNGSTLDFLDELVQERAKAKLIERHVAEARNGQAEPSQALKDFAGSVVMPPRSPQPEPCFTHKAKHGQCPGSGCECICLERGPQPGEVWRPRDPRRKASFTVKAVTKTEVIAEDGRSVSLERMKRYEKVG